MSHYSTLTRLRANPAVRTGLFVVGIALILSAPLVGVIPGPGGILVFAAGLALALQNSRWAKRQYVRFKRWHPGAGRWADWGLRRKSAKRRDAIAKAEAEDGQTEPQPSRID